MCIYRCIIRAIAPRIGYTHTSRFLTDLSFETLNPFPGSPGADNLQRDRLWCWVHPNKPVGF
ncbi:hypothetical protein [Anabaena sp. CS-542/02]|uniref:hypothetical protein n=1 Tax=Anabaena sp. CS-542/02 TaxID=3021719 RepID=UPI00232C4DDD|nr:hypothetical protein [Anabaena sp. CS-542/02]MDB9444811.1 hypothetical protein [Anabaena sp. CS-542/02]